MVVLPCSRRRSHTSPTPSSGSPTASLGTQNISTILRFSLFTSYRHIQHFSVSSRNCHIARKIRSSYVLLFCTLFILHNSRDTDVSGKGSLVLEPHFPHLNLPPLLGAGPAPAQLLHEGSQCLQSPQLIYSNIKQTQSGYRYSAVGHIFINQNRSHTWEAPPMAL